MEDRYGRDVLAPGWRDAGRRVVPSISATPGTVLEVAGDGFCGAVIAVTSGVVELEDRRGARRVFPLGAGFLVDGDPVIVVAPRAETSRAAPRTASGSIRPDPARARVARASRILVEGRHDAELIEKVWGDDLRDAGVVVQPLDGIDLLPRMLSDDPPSPSRRYGVLVDHLVSGSKEERLARGVTTGRHGPFVRVVGHPFVDVWQCVRPAAVGIPAWPSVDRGTEWKTGVCRALGWPAAGPADLARAWLRILGAVRDYRDLEPALLGRVEELIDFVTAPSPIA